MYKLVFLFAILCAVYGAEVGTEKKPAEVDLKQPGFPAFPHQPFATPYSAFPYNKFDPYYRNSAFPYQQNPAYPYGAYNTPYNAGYVSPYQRNAFGYTSPLQKSLSGVPPLAAPHAAFGAYPFGLHGNFGYPGQFPAPAFNAFGRPEEFKRTLDVKKNNCK